MWPIVHSKPVGRSTYLAQMLLQSIAENRVEAIQAAAMVAEQHLSLGRMLTEAQLTGSQGRRHHFVDVSRPRYGGEAVDFAQNAVKL